MREGGKKAEEGIKWLDLAERGQEKAMKGMVAKRQQKTSLY